MSESKQIVRKKRGLKTVLLLILVLLITFLPLLVVQSASFSGADGLASDMIVEQNKDFRPWMKPLFKPASGEVESLLFALQAAIGSGVTFYILGFWKGKKQGELELGLEKENKDYAN